MSIDQIVQELEVLVDEQKTLLKLHPTFFNGAEDAAYENREQKIVELRWELQAFRNAL